RHRGGQFIGPAPMMGLTHLLQALLVCSLRCVWTQFVDQPLYMVASQGEKVTILCHLKNSACYWMYWYQQSPQGGEMQLLFNSGGEDSVNDYTKETYSAERPKEEEFHLLISRAMLQHASVYYCAC
ncbi:hypothetical protein NDU88_000390, partial [Pleurodeles waltl]